MFEKEAEEYAGNREVCDLLDAISEDLQNYDYGTVAHYNIDPLVEECFKDGAEFGYNKAMKEWRDCFMSCSSPYCADKFRDIQCGGILGNMTKEVRDGCNREKGI